MMNHSRNLPCYIGRFAPSPTGDLHFGSLLAAVASYLQARGRGGQWLVRIDDIDPPREVAGSARRILRDLERLGMIPDQPVLFQSTRISEYGSARQSLLHSGQAYYCSCSRKSLPADGVYPGNCRSGHIAGKSDLSVRIRTNDTPVEFHDRVQGETMENLAKSCGDFVIWRADDLPAYQLAVVMDDAFQGVTQIVRGADLLGSTARQIFLQRALGLPSPSYAHLPVATLRGSKLSKRLESDPVSALDPAYAIHRALEFLGHRPPQNLDLGMLWTWAKDHWDMRRIPARKTAPADGGNGIWTEPL
jgi:glutamyl-Q tRNA(Asp) synthetase